MGSGLGPNVEGRCYAAKGTDWRDFRNDRPLTTPAPIWGDSTSDLLRATLARSFFFNTVFHIPPICTHAHPCRLPPLPCLFRPVAVLRSRRATSRVRFCPSCCGISATSTHPLPRRHRWPPPCPTPPRPASAPRPPSYPPRCPSLRLLHFHVRPLCYRPRLPASSYRESALRLLSSPPRGRPRWRVHHRH